MRIVPLHTGSTAPGKGAPIEPNTSLVSLIAQLDAEAGVAVSASASVLGEIEGFTPQPILFGGASIISFSGTETAQWDGQVESCGYERIYLQLLTLSTLTSFRATATEAEL